MRLLADESAFDAREEGQGEELERRMLRRNLIDNLIVVFLLLLLKPVRPQQCSFRVGAPIYALR